MPNQLPYQNAQGGQIPRPPAPRTESGAPAPATGVTPSPASGQQRPQEGTQSFADRAEKAVDQVKTTAIEKVGDVRSRAEHEIADQRAGIVQRVQRVSDVLRNASEQIRHDDEFVAHYLDQASHGVERVAGYVRSADTRRLTQDVQSFARSRPAWFIGGAFVAGLAIGRFLKSSPPRDSAQFDELYPERF